MIGICQWCGKRVFKTCNKNTYWDCKKFQDKKRKE